MSHPIAPYVAALLLSVSGSARADTTAEAGMTLFADHCFSPLMSMVKASELFGEVGLRYDFYDLDPFANGAPSPVVGRPATPGTDRRCEISFDGDHAKAATEAALAGLQAEGITQDVPLPDTHTELEGTALIGARRLNPRRIAVVQTGTRPGPNGIETYLNVERLTPSASLN